MLIRKRLAEVVEAKRHADESVEGGRAFDVSGAPAEAGVNYRRHASRAFCNMRDGSACAEFSVAGDCGSEGPARGQRREDGSWEIVIVYELGGRLGALSVVGVKTPGEPWG